MKPSRCDIKIPQSSIPIAVSSSIIRNFSLELDKGSGLKCNVISFPKSIGASNLTQISLNNMNGLLLHYFKLNMLRSTGTVLLHRNMFTDQHFVVEYEGSEPLIQKPLLDKKTGHFRPAPTVTTMLSIGHPTPSPGCPNKAL